MAESGTTPPNEVTQLSMDGQFPKTPEGEALRFTAEFDAAEKELRDWQDAGDTIVKQFLDDRKNNPNGDTGSKTTRLNFYSTNVKLVRYMVFGKVPKASVDRIHGDPNDDVGRVGGKILERETNALFERTADAEDNVCDSFNDALSDYQMPGYGCMTLQYSFDTKQIPGKDAIKKMDEQGSPVEYAIAVPPSEKRVNEKIVLRYRNWKDCLWNAGSRTFRDRRWMAFRSRMSRQSLQKRFGKEVGTAIPLNSKRQQKSSEPDNSQQDPIATADVWEVWDKENLRRFFFVKGYVRTLDIQPMDDDTWGLPGFWPCARPMMANVTTSKDIPRPDYVLVQDVYEEINAVSTRITKLQQTIAAKGVYDKTAGESVGRLLQESSDNQLFPVENWAKFAQAGGLEGVIDLLPLEQLIAALDKLRDYRQELISILYQLEGRSDIMRGQQTENGTPGEAALKTKFASVMLQAMQDELARFVTDTLRIRAWMVSKYFEPETILQRSNAQYMNEAPELVWQAIQFVKQNIWQYRLTVRAETMAMDDFLQQKQEALEVLTGLTAYAQAIAPLAQYLPQAIPTFLELLKLVMARFKGGASFESILDPAVTQAKQMLAQAQSQPQAPAPPDPRMMAQMAKGAADKEKILLQAQADQAYVQTETAAVKERAEHANQLKLQQITATHAAKAAFTPPKPPANGGQP